MTAKKNEIIGARFLAPVTGEMVNATPEIHETAPVMRDGRLIIATVSIPVDDESSHHATAYRATVRPDAKGRLSGSDWLAWVEAGSPATTAAPKRTGTTASTDTTVARINGNTLTASQLRAVRDDGARGAAGTLDYITAMHRAMILTLTDGLNVVAFTTYRADGTRKDRRTVTVLVAGDVIAIQKESRESEADMLRAEMAEMQAASK